MPQQPDSGSTQQRAVLRYQRARDLYVGRSVIVEGETFTTVLGELVERGYEPAAAVDLLVRESSWTYRTAGVRARLLCRTCGAPLGRDASALPYCGPLCQAADCAGERWSDPLNP
jgi:hypothetical protein